jgi:hypothetical protein
MANNGWHLVESANTGDGDVVTLILLGLVVWIYWKLS